MGEGTDSPDYALLHPDGRIEYGWRRGGEKINDALRRRIDQVATQGMGRLRAWFTDNFSAEVANPLADRVWSSVGYEHPTGWRGVVAVTMEGDGDSDCPPLSPEVCGALNDIVGG